MGRKSNDRKSGSEFVSSAGKAFEIVKALSDELHEHDGTDDDLKRILNDETLRRDLARRIVLTRKYPVESVWDLVQVPNLSAHELVRRVQSTLYPLALDVNLMNWDFYQNVKGEVVDAGGKDYEVMLYSHSHSLQSGEDVRAFFAEKGFVGNVPAFLAWIAQRQTDGQNGWYVSIPEDDRCFQNPKPSRDLTVPEFFNANGIRMIKMVGMDVFDCGVVFVAFREIK